MSTNPKFIDVTVKDLAKHFKVDVLAASGFVKFLAENDLAEKIGTAEREPGKKGKNSALWRIPTTIKLNPLRMREEEVEEEEEDSKKEEISAEDTFDLPTD